MNARTTALALAATALACAPPDPPRPPLPDAAPFDANLDAPRLVFEAGPRRDAGLDAPSARPDAPGLDASGTDAGPDVVTVDGALTEDAWTLATATSTDVVSGSPFSACSLNELRVVAGDSTLFLGLRAHLDPSCNAAIVVYVDVDPGLDRGRVLDGSTGTDTANALHRVISGPLTSFTADIWPDLAWGTRTTPLTRSVGLGESGWRRIGTTPYTAPTEQVSACSAAECETSISYASLGLGSGAHRVALFARLGDGVDWAAPALPPETPSSVVVTTLSVDLVVP